MSRGKHIQFCCAVNCCAVRVGCHCTRALKASTQETCIGADATAATDRCVVHLVLDVTWWIALLRIMGGHSSKHGHLHSSVFPVQLDTLFRKIRFFKKNQPTRFSGVLFGFALYWVFWIFLFERAVGKLVGWLISSAKLLFRFATSRL